MKDRRRPRRRLRPWFILTLIVLCAWGGISIVRAVTGSEAEDYQTAEPTPTPDPEIIEVALVGIDQQDEPDTRITVWLDAGHGGGDPGTYVTHPDGNIYERDIVLDIVLKVYELFNQSSPDIRVLLTRSDNSHVRLDDRIALWNAENPDLVVSVHADFYAGPTAQSVSGVQVNYHPGTRNSGRLNITGGELAQSLQTHLANETGARDRGTRATNTMRVPAESTMPAVLIETGFMSNDTELALLTSTEYQMAIARAIYNGIVEVVRQAN